MKLSIISVHLPNDDLRSWNFIQHSVLFALIAFFAQQEMQQPSSRWWLICHLNELVSESAFHQRGSILLWTFLRNDTPLIDKRWGFLFTCLTTRAVHVEIAHSIDANTCVMGIEQFIARRSWNAISNLVRQWDELSRCKQRPIGMSAQLG